MNYLREKILLISTFFIFCAFDSIAKDNIGESIEISSLSIENRVQILLFDLGYDIEKNGIYDEKTKTALKQFYIDVGLKHNGELIKADIEVLINAFEGGFRNPNNKNVNISKKATNKSLSTNDVKKVQKMLSELGYKVSTDGVYGSQTEIAISQFYSELGFEYDGVLDEDDIIILKNAISAGFQKYVKPPDFPKQTATKSDILWAQKMLIELGYLEGKADGIYGKKTHSALQNFWKGLGLDYMLTDNGILDDDSLSRLEIQSSLIIEENNSSLNEKKFISNDEYNCEPAFVGEQPKIARGLINNKNISADWYLNNNFGRWFMGSKQPKLKSCMKRNGSGWYFDVQKVRQKNGGYKTWHAPTIIIGHKGWNDSFGYSKEFPVRISDIASLDFNVNYILNGSGLMQTGVYMYFVSKEKTDNVEKAYEKVPKLEMIVAFNHSNNINGSSSDYSKQINCAKKKLKKYKKQQREVINTSNSKWYACYNVFSNAGDFDHKAGLRFNLSNGYLKPFGEIKKYDINFKDLIDKSVEQGWINADDVLLGLEFQSETWFGNVEMNIQSMSHKLVKRQ